MEGGNCHGCDLNDAKALSKFVFLASTRVGEILDAICLLATVVIICPSHFPSKMASA